MKDYIIITDSCSDLPAYLIEDEHLKVLPLGFNIDGKNYKNYSDERDMTNKEFYSLIRNKKNPTTSQVTPIEFINAIEPILKDNKDVLCIIFSSALSGTYNSLLIAKEELEEKYQNAKIIAIDSLCSSFGQGLLIHQAINLKKDGKTIDEVARFVEDNKLNLCHFFTGDDLYHMKRGGRLSATKAFLGTVLQLKPIIYMDNMGRLVPITTARGRKGAFKKIIKLMEERITSFTKTVFISHGDCVDDANFVALLIKEKFNIKNIFLSFIGPVIGSHAGPNVIGVFFFGSHR
ncbi:TPA: DegV family protein [bacterium]|jgi:DegV family protein with EDD domain|nr:DegV family protein [bacterium]